jgi:hypothetical protein
MRATSLSVALLLVFASMTHAKLEIKDVKAVHGMYGPERKSLDVLPGDEVFFRFTVAGVKVNGDGKVDCKLTLSLTNADGDELLGPKGRESPLEGVLALGGDSFLSSALVTLCDGITAGLYTVTVGVEDNLSEQKTSFTRKLTCRKPQFAIVAPRFFHDQNNLVPAPVGGRVGQRLFFKVRCIGYERGGGRIDNEMKVEILDAAGKSTMPKPLVVKFVKDDAAEVKKLGASYLFRGDLTLNRAGEFKLRITLTDRLSKQTAKYETPLNVTAP